MTEMHVRDAPASQDVFVERADAMQVLLAIWLHGRSPHSTRAYQANIARFLAHTGKPLTAVTLADLQGYADSLAAADLAPRKPGAHARRRQESPLLRAYHRLPAL